MLPEWIYWIVIVVLIAIIASNVGKLDNLEEKFNSLQHMFCDCEKDIEHYKKISDKYYDSYCKVADENDDLKEENTQLKLYLYQNISDYYKRNPDKKN